MEWNKKKTQLAPLKKLKINEYSCEHLSEQKLQITPIRGKDPELTLEEAMKECAKAPDIFVGLSGLESFKYKILIPPTIVKTPPLPPVFLFTNEKGFVKTSRKQKEELASALSQFFKFSQKMQRIENDWPKFEFSTEDSLQYCFSNFQALNKWAESNSPKQKLQYYVIPYKRVLRKIRIYWKNDEEIRFFLVINKKPVPKSKHAFHLTGQSGFSQGIFQHKLSDFNYAGQLLKTSFSPSFPHKSVLFNKRRLLRKSQKTETREKENKEIQIFKLKNNKKAIVIEVEEIEEVDEMVTEIIDLVNQIQKKTDKRMLVTLIADFVSDEFGNWFFLKVKAEKLDYLSTQRESILLPLPVDFPKEGIRTSSRKSSVVAPITVPNIKQRLSELEEKNRKFSKRTKSFNQLSGEEFAEFIKSEKPFRIIGTEETEKGLAFFAREEIELENRHFKSKTPNNIHLDRIAAHYDKVRHKAKASKELYYTNSLLREFSKGTSRVIIDKVLSVIKEHPDFVGAYRKLDNGVVMAKIEKTNELVYTIRMIVSALKLKKKEFNHFLNIVLAECRKLNLEEKLLNLIQKSLILSHNDFN